MGGQFASGTGLADARLPGKHDDAALAGNGVIQGPGKLGHLPLAANEDVGNVTSGLGFYHACSFHSPLD